VQENDFTVVLLKIITTELDIMNNPMTSAAAVLLPGACPLRFGVSERRV
jgi:hypothetical protein